MEAGAGEDGRRSMNKTELVYRLKEIQVISKKSVTLRSGVTSDFYCDIKKAFGHPDIANAIADEIIKILPTSTTVVAASGYGGLPLGILIAAKSGKKFTAVRDTSKDHGKGGEIDGYLPNLDDVVAVVDDVLTTGSSIKSTMSSLKEAGIIVKHAAVVVKRAEVELDIPCLYLFTIDDLI